MLHLSQKNKKYGNSFNKLGLKKKAAKRFSLLNLSRKVSLQTNNYCISLLKDCSLGLENNLERKRDFIEIIEDHLNYSPLNSTQFISAEHYKQREIDSYVKEKEGRPSQVDLKQTVIDLDDDIDIPTGGTMVGINTLDDLNIARDTSRNLDYDDTDNTSVNTDYSNS
jgi:hypothetical protein